MATTTYNRISLTFTRLRDQNASVSTQPSSAIASPSQSGTPIAQRAQTEATVEQRTFELLFTRFGPLVSADDAWKTLSFPTLDSFNRAIQRKRLPLRLIRPPGRRKAFVSTADLATYLAGLASKAAT
jgi:hypothetical protein